MNGNSSITKIRVGKPAILDDVPGSGHVAIEAHAGTGKTYTIEHLVVDLLLRGAVRGGGQGEGEGAGGAGDTEGAGTGVAGCGYGLDGEGAGTGCASLEGPPLVGLENILVVTFTEKAVNELKSRIRAIIEKVLLQDTHNVQEDQPHWAVGSGERAVLRDALFAFDSAPISTIHSFCRRILVENAFFSGRPFAQQIVDGQTIMTRALQQFLRKAGADFSPGAGGVEGGGGESREWEELKQRDREEWYGPVLHYWFKRFGNKAYKELLQLLMAAHRAGLNQSTGPDGSPELILPSGHMVLEVLEQINDGFDQLLTTLGQFSDEDDRVGKLSSYVCRTLTMKPGEEEGAPEFARDLLVLRDLIQTLAARFPAPGDSPDDTLAFLFQCLVRLEEPVSRVLNWPPYSGFRGRNPPFRPLKNNLNSLVKVLDKHLLSGIGVWLFAGPVQELAAGIKEAEGLYDFEDMLALVARALAQGENADQLIRLLRSRYPYALVDEFQDTDRTQWEIFRRIYFDEEGCPVPGTRLFIIGDPKQAIYRFRGADVHTYLDARSVVAPPGSGRRLQLLHNYRSTGPMIQAYNAILKNEDGSEAFFGQASESPDHGGATQGEILYGEPVKCGRPDLVALWGGDDSLCTPVELLSPDLPKQKKGGAGGEDGGGGGIEIPKALRALSESDLLAWMIAAKIKELLTNPESGLQVPASEGGHRPLTASDIFVLTRSGMEGIKIGGYLRQQGVPFSFFKQGGLFKTTEAIHIRNMLAAVEQPGDRGRLALALASPFFAVPGARVPVVIDSGQRSIVVRLLTELNELAVKRQFNLLFNRMMEETGLIRRELIFADSERELTNYLHLFEILLEEASAGRNSLGELLGFLSRRIEGIEEGGGEGGMVGGDGDDDGDSEGDLQRIDTERDSVQIMTMHKSKGLEAEVVFVYGGFGTGRRKDSVIFFQGGDGEKKVAAGYAEGGPEHEAELREVRAENLRILYVAMTRAKSRLYLPLMALDEKAKKSGFYDPLNRRLHGIVEELGEGRPLDSLFRVSTLTQFLAVGAGAGAGEGDVEGAEATRDARVAGGPGERGGVGEVKVEQAWGEALAGVLRKLDRSVDSEGWPPFSKLAEQFHGVAVESYTSMKTLNLLSGEEDGEGEGERDGRRGRARARARARASLEEQQKVRVFSEDDPRGFIDEVEPEQGVGAEGAGGEFESYGLPPGRILGICAHELLERVDLDVVGRWMSEGAAPGDGAGVDAETHPGDGVGAEAADGGEDGEEEQFEGWFASPGVQGLFRHVMRSYGISSRHRVALGRMVFNALTTPLGYALAARDGGGAGVAIPPVCQLEQVLRETEFLYPFPEDSHPRLGEIRAGGFSVENGYIKGFMDLVARIPGTSLHVIGDWKTDRLPGHDPATLARVVAERYSVQSLLYSLAVCKLLRVGDSEDYDRLFGGALYIFVRPGAVAGKKMAVHLERPSWEQLSRVETVLRGLGKNDWEWR